MNLGNIVNNLESSLKQAFENTMVENVVIGISGGVDSALVAAVACNALGKNKVYGFYLPYKTSSQTSYDDALKLAEKFGFSFNVIDISNMADGLINQDIQMDSLRKGNIMARCRMVTLFDMAYKYKAVVLGTSNRVEMLLGYGTWYGDTASGINVLGQLYKREVFALSSYLGVPESIITKAPTGDLWPGQTDENELGFTYDFLDNLLYDIEQNKLSIDELNKKYNKNSVEKIIKRVIRNKFKRHTPIICSGFNERKPIDEEMFLELIK